MFLCLVLLLTLWSWALLSDRLPLASFRDQIMQWIANSLPERQREVMNHVPAAWIFNQEPIFSGMQREAVADPAEQDVEIIHSMYT